MNNRAISSQVWLGYSKPPAGRSRLEAQGEISRSAKRDLRILKNFSSFIINQKILAKTARIFTVN